MEIKENMINIEGYQVLKNELLKLYKEKMPQIIEDLKVACDFGDLRENSEFDAVKENQGKYEKRIRYLEYILNHCEIIDDYQKDTVCLGSIVVIQYLEDGEKEKYHIVSSFESGLAEENVSVLSPVGRCLYGAKLNEIVSIESPNNIYDVKIIKID